MIPNLTATPTHPQPPTPTDLANSVTHYRAPCEVCGADCDWTVKDPAGTCPCVDEAVA